MADRVPGGGDDAEGREAFEYDVFLSFASANHDAADAICRILRQGGLRVFWAPDTLGDALGRDFTDAIEAGLLGSRHFVLFWTAEAKISQWVRAEQKAFYTQCYIRAGGARRLVILPDGLEPISNLPVLLRNLQVARSAEEVLQRLRGAVAVPEPKSPVPPRVEPPRSVHPTRTTEPADPPAGTAIEGPLGMRMRFVPAGTYTIGSPESESGRQANETQHKVQLTRGFWLAETPVTQGQWKQLVPGPKQPSYFKSGGEDLPVESVNWFEATEFANRLSDWEGLARCYELVNPKGTLGGGDFTCDDVIFAGFDCPGYRLPTEAEWEIAARAGVSSAQGIVPDLDAVAWFQGNAGSTNTVGKKVPSKWGFHDLLGNVFEWTGDWYGDYPKDWVVDPLGPPKGLSRVIRGGSWDSAAQVVRAAYRNRNVPSDRWSIIGFRLARGQSALKGAVPGPPQVAREYPGRPGADEPFVERSSRFFIGPLTKVDPKEGSKVETEKRRVLATGKDKDGDITSLCNSYAAWSPRKKAAAISDIEGGRISYFVKVGDNEVGVHVVNDAKKGKYLRTNQDSTGKDNLDNLPDC